MLLLNHLTDYLVHVPGMPSSRCSPTTAHPCTSLSLTCSSCTEISDKEGLLADVILYLTSLSITATNCKPTLQSRIPGAQ